MSYTSGTSGTSGLSGDRFSTTSSTTVTINTGLICIYVAPGLAYGTGQSVVVAYSPSNKMIGIVDSYDKNTGQLFVDINIIYGGGTYSDWAVYLNGATGKDGTNGTSGTSGHDGDKYAIVDSPHPEISVGLICTESPEARFEEVMTISVNKNSTIITEIDEIYLFVCEPNTIIPISYVCDKPTLAGISVNGSKLIIEFLSETVLPNTITIKLSGIRKGRTNSRFIKFSKKEMEKNFEFWSQWRK